MACAFCGSTDPDHFCELKPHPMLVIDDKKWRKFWNWLKRKLGKQED